MLQNIGDTIKSQKWLGYAMLGALGLVFALWGAYGIVDLSFGPGNYAAKVNGEKITAAEVNRAWQEDQPQYLRLFGGELTPEQRTRLQNELLDGYIRNAAVMQHSQQLGFRVSDEQVRKAYESEPAFQVDGKFSSQAARARLAAAGITPAAFDADRRRSLTMNQLAAAIAATDFITPVELARFVALEDEQREVRYALLTPEQFTAGPPVDATAVEASYKAHEADYMTVESVRLAYAELDLADVTAQLQVTDAQLQERYDTAKDRYVEPERRQARHILINVDATTDDAKAHALADEVYGKATGASAQDFAKLAQQYSKDAGSAAQGGDLGWADRTAYVPPFAEALFALQTGQVSKPVKTQYGYHIIKLEGIRPGAAKTFAEARPELEAELRRDLAADQFGERQEQIQQRIERGGGNFDQLVKDFGLRTGEVAEFARGGGGLPLGSDADLNSAVFSDNVLNQRNVGGPLPLGEERLVVFHVLDHKPSVLRPLTEVRDAVMAKLLRERGSEAARKAAETGLTQLGSGEPLDRVAAALKVKTEPAQFVGRADPALPVQVRDAAFALPRPEAGRPQRKVVLLEEGGAALLEGTGARTAPRQANPAIESQRQERQLQRSTVQQIDAYVAELVRKAKVSKNLQVFE